ncbi:hypothetical protein niasHT_021708 [Heterodera trifolii]|uniref:Uncharacterized protein n=1 Tax=Heterodera trifolii TaxID=157864 RepID=A0ABD2KRM4_9BILA
MRGLATPPPPISALLPPDKGKSDSSAVIWRCDRSAQFPPLAQITTHLSVSRLFSACSESRGKAFSDVKVKVSFCGDCAHFLGKTLPAPGPKFGGDLPMLS